MRKLFALLVVLMVVAVPAWAADGDELSTTSFRVDGYGQVYQKVLIENASTGDTVTAAESGKIFIVTPSTQEQPQFELPTADDGLTYTFTQAAGGTAVAVAKYVILDPADTDTFVGCANSGSATTFAAGDALKSPGATGDTVTIIGDDLYWYCVDRVGTWTDNNTGNH